MRGTEYLVTEIVLWLVGAAVIGLIIGWLVRGWRSEKKLRRRAEAPLAEERAKVQQLAEQLADAEKKVADLEAANALASAEMESLTTRVEEMSSDEPDIATSDEDGEISDDEPPSGNTSQREDPAEDDDNGEPASEAAADGESRSQDTLFGDEDVVAAADDD